jgi:Domain of unknown function (DUF4157)
MESRLGSDFSDVRVHTDSLGAESARSISASAYTAGNDIVFAPGKFDPRSSQGRHVLAHELVHVQQQRRGPVSGTGTEGGVTVSDPSDRFEREAEATATRTLSTQSNQAGPVGEQGGPRAGSSRPSSTGNPASVQRFGSEEHVRLGNEAEPGQDVLVTSYGKISYGEMIALGDYFASIEEIESVAATGADGKAQIDLALFKVNPQRTKPAPNPTVEQEVDDRYNRLAARNQTHFSTGSSPGNSNKEQYISRHKEALKTAWYQGINPMVVRPADWEAQEAFADHFLTDAFSAGHVRTPRGAIQEHWSKIYPNFQANLVDTIACYMAAYIHDVDLSAVPTGLLKGSVATEISARGGTKLSSFSIGDVISKVLHDADNTGLDVVSAGGPGGGQGPVHWRAVGDDHLFPSTPNAAATQTAQFAEGAVKASFAEGKHAEQAGRAGDPLNPLLDETKFQALQFIPTADTASTSNTKYDWQAQSLATLPANIKQLIVDAFKPGTEIRNGLDNMPVPAIVNKMGMDLHTGDAWACFRRVMLRDVMTMLLHIAAGETCPPNNDNPCPIVVQSGGAAPVPGVNRPNPPPPTANTAPPVTPR